MDTNICVHFLNGDDEVKQRWLECKPNAVQICSVVKAELLFGARNSARVAHNLRSLEAFFRPLTSIAFDDVAAEHYGTLRAELKRQGTPVGGNDMQIAAIALANQLTLVTRNDTEFRQIANLRIERW